MESMWFRQSEELTKVPNGTKIFCCPSRARHDRTAHPLVRERAEGSEVVSELPRPVTVVPETPCDRGSTRSFRS